MDVCESELAPHKQSSADKARQPLVLAEKNNALNAVSSRRLRTREVSSRYKSPTPSTASVSRRCPSPILTRIPPSNAQFGSKRALSAERKRPSTPPSPRPATPVNESSVDTQFPSRRMSTGGRLPESLWPSTMRSLSVSFQSDTISIPVSKKEKPVPIVSFDRTLRPSSNVAHKQAETPTNLSRKPTPERKRSPLKGKSAPDQSENSKPVDGLHARLIDQHRWPSRIGGKLSSNALNKSVDLADKVVRNSATSIPGIGLSSLRRTPISDCGLSRPLQKSTSDGAARLLSLDYIGRVGSEAKAIDDNSVRISGPYKHMPTSSSEKSTLATLAARTQSLPIPGSPRPASPSRTSLLSASRGISPSRGRPSTPSSPSRGMSPSRIRSSTTTSQSTSSTSVLSFIADFKKGKKSANYIDDAHQLRLLYNRYLQWRFANARAEAVLYMHKVKAEETLYNVWKTTLVLWDSVIRKRINLQQLKLELNLNSVLNDQIAYLDDWASLEREHISSLSGVVEDLEASTLRVPLNGGAKADIESLKTAVCSAVDVMQAMGSSICSLLSRVEEMNSRVSELAVIAAKETTMLDECETLLASTSAMQLMSRIQLFTHQLMSVRRSGTRNLLVSLLKGARALTQLTQIHAQIIVNGLQNDLSTLTKLAHKLSDFDAMCYARDLFFSVPKPDLFLFNVIIRGFSSNNMPQSSILLFTHLRKSTVLKPDKFTYSFTVSAASSWLDHGVGVLLHGQAIVDGYESDMFLGSALVDMYCRFSLVESARKVFDRIPVKDPVLYNTMISGLMKNSCFEDSIWVFWEMLKNGGNWLDSTSVAAVLPAVAELQELRLGMEIQCLGMKLGFHDHVYVLTGLVSLYSKCGEIEKAKLLFREIDRPDLICCNAMISGYSCNGETKSSVMLFKKLLASGEKVKSSSIVGLIPVSFPFGHLCLTDSIHSFSVKTGIVSNSSVSSALTTVYSRLNEIETARQLFDESSEKSLASWNAMIAGYTQNGLTEQAISLFQEMQMSNVIPNPVTITSILSACAQLGALSMGKWVHGLVRIRKFESNIFVSTALIDMYAKCGSIVEARQLFDLMPEKNEVTWNAMISGYGLHGRGQEAIKLFSEMMHSGIRPTGVTFLSTLYACSHAGLVREGNEIFKSMVHDHGFKPLAEHYACMVDILGRAGQLEKALEFIKGLPVEPGPPVWGALLGACMIHKDTNLACVASEKLFELDPENVGYYVLLSNIYSAEKNYPQAASVRQVVKKRKLAKTPGCTLIEVGENPHMFTSGDRSHPQTNAIYAKLEELSGKMREAGFQSETVTALHDVEEEEKELMVNLHSEKLAIAFGLIATEPGSEIRIIKNLRVCLDCHTATKFISKITQRVIVVRDANRFHHFEDGVCSCRDYW